MRTFWRFTGIACGGLVASCYSPNETIVGDETSTSVDATSAGPAGPDSGSGSGETNDPSDTSTGGGSGTATGTIGSSDTSSSDDAPAVCGNGEVEGGEACDDAVNDGGYGGCAVDCSGLGPHCGDGELNGPEPCDDGNDANGDGCNVDCEISGTAIWTRSFAGEPGFVDSATSVAVGAEDGLILAGSVGTAAADSDVLLLAYDTDGSLLWNEVHAFGNDSTAWGVAIDSDGNIGIAGDEDGDQVIAAMFDPDGALLWSDLVADVGGADLGGQGAAFDDSGDLYVVGQVFTGSYDIGVRHYSETGTLVWAEAYDGGLNDSGRGIAIAGEAIFVVGGTLVSASDSNGWIRRYDLNGAAIWTREFSGEDAAYDQTWAVGVDPTGNVVATGISSPDGIASQAWLRKYDLDGAEQWTVLYDVDPAGNAGFGLAVDEAGQIALVGVNNFMSMETFVAKHGSDGAQLWIDYPHEGAVQPQGSVPIRGVAIDSQSNIVVAGSLDGDVWVRKYAP